MVETDDQSVAIFHSASVSVLTRTKKKDRSSMSGEEGRERRGGRGGRSRVLWRGRLAERVIGWEKTWGNGNGHSWAFDPPMQCLTTPETEAG
ncbi:hypothetical protein IAQ61_001391 [Plenodomus lingam]|uniref:uncharacterized protein n=1 Tax=Leptosphaeria maculans TaxID=5022 RepID=UPI00331BEBE3|nr:hypothetical protein IAQ61_001391 [Plenodomus lingam]